MKPDFIDNREGNTLDHAIRNHLGALRCQEAKPEELCIATAYFNPHGLELLADETKHVDRIRLLLGAEPKPEAARSHRRPGDPREPEFTHREVHTALKAMEQGLHQDRNLLPFDLGTDQAIHRLLEFLESGKIDVRRYEGHFLHAKAFVFRGPERGVIAGSSNLTYAGLRRNLELNLGHYADPLVGKVEEWFDRHWDEAQPYDLAAIYRELLAEFPPYLIYLKVLWHLYGDELAKEEEETGHIPVTQFQKHGVWRARRVLEKYGGVLIADGVGLGKTFSAGEIIRAYRERRQRVLLICPASLRDTTWKKFCNDFQLMIERVSYEELARDRQLGGDQDHLDNPLEDYALVVVDEAHNYRNPDTPTRAAVLRLLLRGKRRDLVMLSATPVNNSLWDLYHVLRYFLKQDAALADRGVRSVRDRFDLAMQVDPYNLNPDLLYPVIDATTVKRTRKFVKKHYQGDRIKGPDGKLMPIRFPTPVASSITYDLDEVLPGFFGRFQEILMPASGSPQLTMARYKPESYPAGRDPDAEDTALVGLIRSGLLKRFESSAYAFRRTISRMASQHETFLEALDHGRVVRKEFLKEMSAADEATELDELLEESEHVEDASLFNVASLRRDVENDLTLLRELEEQAAQVRAEGSPKLAALVDELAAIATQAREEAIDEDDFRERRKVLVFSFFEDTIDWVEGYLKKVVDSDDRLACYRGRIASVSGAESRHGIPRKDAIHGFAPVSSGAPPGLQQNRFDLLLSTDVLAEGMNLQQCRNIINLDLPWNPMRLVQRHGRIDRIGGQHRTVYLRTFFPDRQLNALLDLEERVRRKLAQAAASVGVENAPIEYGATGEQTFADTREEIEKLRKEDASIYEAGGTESAAQTGEEYRQELRVALQTRGEEIRTLPWKAGSGMVRGEQQGHFFCAQVGERIFLRFVPADGGLVVSEIGSCLRMIECVAETPRQLSPELTRQAYGAWDSARASIHESWMVETDPANLQPKVRKLNREVAEFIRANPPADVDQDRLGRCLDAVETPWSRREENTLREVFKHEVDDPRHKSKLLVEAIEEAGVEPMEVPEPLPPIAEDEVHLICWMALEGE